MKANKSRSRRILVLAVAAASMATVNSQTSLAQGAMLEEVVVTARKRTEDMQSIPDTVSVISSSAIRDTHARDIRGIEYAVPNALIESGNGNTSSMSIRGISLSDLEKSFDPAIGIIVDDVYLGSTSASLLSMFDVERIEVLRGPQGTLQGKNTTGGVLKIVRSKPTGEFGGKAAVTVGSYDRVDVKALVNVPIVPDVLAGKFSYYGKSGGGFVKNVATGDYDGDQDFKSYNASLLWTPTDSFEAQYSYTRDHDESEAFPFINSSPDDSLMCNITGQCDSTLTGEREFNSTELQPTLFDVNLHILRMDWDLEHHQLTSVSGYRDLDEEIRLDYDGSSADFYLTDRPATDTTFSQEVRLSSLWSDTLDYVVGVYYWDREYTLDQTTHQLFLLPFYQSGGVQYATTEQETDSWSAFFQGDYHLTNRLTVTAGIRYTHEKKSAFGELFYLNSAGVSVVSIADATPVAGNGPTDTYGGTESWSEATPKIGLSYDISDDAMVFASYTNGFRSGGFNGRARSQSALGPYEPETVNNYEFGLKSEWLGRSLRFNPTVFYATYDDKQEEFATFVDASPLTVIENAATAKLWGAEMELQYVNGGLMVAANYGYLNSEYDDYTVVNASGVVTDKTDNLLLLAPEHTFGVTAHYAHYVPKLQGDLEYMLGAKYRSEYQTSGDQPDHALVDGYTIVNGSVSLQRDDIRISLFVNNLTDEYYRPFTKNVTNAVTGASLWSFSTVNEPRTWGVELSFDF